MSSIALQFSSPPADDRPTLTLAPFTKGSEAHPAMTGDLALEAARQRFEGKIGQGIWLQERVGGFGGLVGVGDADKTGAFRRAGAHAVSFARGLKAERLVLDIREGVDARQARELAEGLALTSYRFDTYKKPTTDDERIGELKEIFILAGDHLTAGLQLGVTLADAVCFARDLANEQPGVCTPTWLAGKAQERAQSHGLEVTILDEDALQERGFNMHLAVARGSDEPARLLHAVYRPAGDVTRKVALVGKGVTFDSGGYSIKPAASMLDMHIDMGGAAAVFGAMDVIGATKPEGVEVHFIVPMAENMISGAGYKTNDVLRAYNGVTVEVHNTDAEGRLLLGDALAYAVEQGVDQVVDLATLTGACVVALGTETAGVFSPSRGLRQSLEDAAARADEALWPLPLVDRMAGQLDSRVADMKNVGSRWGGAISAAMFLQKFVGETEWAHIDLAGPAMADSAWEYICAGGTGYGVLLLAAWLGVLPEDAVNA